MPGDLRTSPNVFTRFLRFFFYLIYEPFAWSYDLVAWVVSLGRWKNWVFSTLPELPGPRVLELGHGPGHLQLALNKKGVYVFGIDRSAPMGRIAHKRLHSGQIIPNLVRATAEHLPFPPDHPHLTLLRSCNPHFVTLEGHYQSLSLLQHDILSMEKAFA